MITHILALIQFSNAISKIRKIVIVLALAASLCFTVTTADAAGSYYTFQGNITAIDNFYGFLSPDIYVGKPVTYTFFMDFAINGTYTRNNGEVLIAQDNWANDYFYTDYISGDALDELSDGGYWNSQYNYAETNYGVEFLAGSYIGQFNIYGNSDNNSMAIFGYSFGLGDSFTSSNTLWSANGVTANVWSNNLTLQSVIVPEPISSTLFVVGAATLGFRRFRKA